MKKEDYPILEELSVTRNLSERTEKLYKTTINKYTEFTGKSMAALLEEAEAEEDKKIPWKKSKLRKRLLEYRVHLYEKYMLSTAKMEFSRVLTIYRHFEITFQKLPPISEKHAEENNLKFKDLLTKDIIKEALRVSDALMESIILFQSSSGCSAAETLHLKVDDLVASVQDYYPAANIQDLLYNLKDKDDIVPTFQLKRPKTGKEFYTFCTPEAFKSICFYLRTRKGLRGSDRLFKVTQLHLMQKFREINDILGLGTIGLNNFVRFRSHMLRKYHASTLYNDGMSREVVNDLQGKSKNKVDNCYFIEDPQKLKAKYISHMGCLFINMEMTYLDMKSKEYQLLESELQRKSKEYDELKDRVLNIESTINNSMSREELEILDKYV